MLTMGRDGTVRLWNLVLGEEERWVFNQPDLQLVSAALSASERILYLLTEPIEKSEQASMKIFFIELFSGKLHEKELFSMEFSQSKLLADKYNETIVYITKSKSLLCYDREENSLKVLYENSSEIKDAVILGGGELLILADEHSKISAYSLKTRRIMLSLKSNQPVESLLAGVDYYSFFSLHLQAKNMEIKLWDYKSLMDSGRSSPLFSKNLAQVEYHNAKLIREGESVVLFGTRAIGGFGAIRIMNISSGLLKNKIESPHVYLSKF